jgi:hypothetical protein
MNGGPSRLFWIEMGLAALSALLLVLTLLVPDWIEVLFHVDPDRHNGSLEVGIAVALAVATAVSSVLAGREWRRPAASVSGSR